MLKVQLVNGLKNIVRNANISPNQIKSNQQNLFKGTGIAAAMYDETDKNNAAEWQANYLVQAILMPSGQIKRCFYDVYEKSNNSKDTIETMANIFEVSRQAMEIRLKNFKLVD
ncbi:MAG: ImmA/IrrE family metallo-endopeptidase [Erysipelotrichia bacterium]|nr:ImmA/IrrE family metallo-endopeptidase [Erysipelotrichia bacterium]